MALFGKKTEEKKETRVVKSVPQNTPSGASSDVLLRPRITEKGTFQAGARAYVFDVALTANKHDVRLAVKALYNVSPVKIHILAIPKKTTFVRGKLGVRGGGKKAVVYLKEGDKIEFV